MLIDEDQLQDVAQQWIVSCAYFLQDRFGFQSCAIILVHRTSDAPTLRNPDTPIHLFLLRWYGAYVYVTITSQLDTG